MRLYYIAILLLETVLVARCSSPKNEGNTSDSSPAVGAIRTGGSSGGGGSILVGSGGSEGSTYDSGAPDLHSSIDTRLGEFDLAEDKAVGCVVSGVTFQVGEQVITSTKPCVSSCICLNGGVLGHCTGGCPEEAGAPQCGPVGATLPGSCGGTCDCLTGGIIANCTVPCNFDGGIDSTVGH